MSIDTVNDLPRRVQYVALPAQTDFDYTFPIFADEDLVIEVDGVVQALDTDYTVSGEGDDEGGTATFTSGLVGGEIVTLYSDMTIERRTDIAQNGPWSSSDYNDEMDRIFLILRELKDSVARCLRVPVSAEVDDADIELTVSEFANTYVTIDADGKPTPAVLSASTITQSVIGQLLYPQTPSEVTAGVTPSSYVYNSADDLGSMGRYGAAGDYAGTPGAGTDDTAALRRAFLVLQARGGGSIDLGSRRYRIYADGTTTPLGDLSSTRGVRIISSGAELVVDRTFTGTQTVQLLKFTACNGVHFEGPLVVTCTQSQPTNEHTSRGPNFATFLQGCTNITCQSLKATDFHEVWHTSRLPADPVSYASRNFDMGVTHAYRCGYPWSSSLSGYNVKIVLHTEQCGRSYFPTGGRNHNVEVYGKDNEASVDCLIATDAGEGMQGMRLKYVNKESTFADNSRNGVRLEVQDSDLYVATHRDIEIDLDISNTSAGVYMGYGFSIAKFKNDDTADATDRGHILENIEVRGSIKGGSANQRSINTASVGTWGAGENLDNIRFRNLRMSVVGQPSFDLTSLKKTALLDNVYSSAQMNLVGNTTAKITCIGVECDAAISGSTGDTSKVNFTSCKFGSLTNQSVTNKKFYDCEGLGSSYTATGTGYASGPTGSIKYSVNGDVVTLDIPSISGTSNSTSLTFTGMPVQIRPAANQTLVGRYTDNGADAVGLIRVETDGTLRFYNQATSSTSFTNSGTKGTPAQTISYRISS